MDSVMAFLGGVLVVGLSLILFIWKSFKAVIKIAQKDNEEIRLQLDAFNNHLKRIDNTAKLHTQTFEETTQTLQEACGAISESEQQIKLLEVKLYHLQTMIVQRCELQEQTLDEHREHLNNTRENLQAIDEKVGNVQERNTREIQVHSEQIEDLVIKLEQLRNEIDQKNADVALNSEQIQTQLERTKQLQLLVDYLQNNYQQGKEDQKRNLEQMTLQTGQIEQLQSRVDSLHKENQQRRKDITNITQITVIQREKINQLQMLVDCLQNRNPKCDTDQETKAAQEKIEANWRLISQMEIKGDASPHQLNQNTLGIRQKAAERSKDELTNVLQQQQQQKQNPQKCDKPELIITEWQKRNEPKYRTLDDLLKKTEDAKNPQNLLTLKEQRDRALEGLEKRLQDLIQSAKPFLKHKERVYPRQNVLLTEKVQPELNAAEWKGSGNQKAEDTQQKNKDEVPSDDGTTSTPLASSGTINVTSAEITKNVTNVNAGPGMKALHKAAQEGDLDHVKLLLKLGDYVDSTDDLLGLTPLHLACSYGHLEVVNLLIQHGANVNRPNMDGRTPLLYAINKGKIAVVQLLISSGADVNMAAGAFWTPLLEAYFYGHTQIAALLTERGANDTGRKRTEK